MSTTVYPIERLTEYVCAKTLELVKELGEGLERVAKENPDLPGIDRLIETVDADPLPLFALSLYVQLRALHHALFPDDAVAAVRERAVVTLAHGLTNAGFVGPLNEWLTALDSGWDRLAAGEQDDAWIEPIVKAIETHYAMPADENGVIWVRLFYLTLIAEAYRTNAATLAKLAQQFPELVSEAAAASGS